MSKALLKMCEEYEKKHEKRKTIGLAYYDVAIINKNGWFEIISNVLALSKVDAMHIVEIKYGVTAKDAVISE